MTELETQVLNIIEDLYKCKYTGKLKVEQNENCYTLKLFLTNQDFSNIQISVETDDFLGYIKKELLSRRLDRNKFFKLVRYDEKRENYTDCG